MKTKVFISKANQGWSELEVPEEFKKLSYEKLVGSVYAYLKQFSYKGLLITQNPSPFRYHSRLQEG